MKKYYLVTEVTVFVDPHGSVDLGGIVKRVEYTDEYNDLDPELTYNDDLEEVNEEDYEGSEDGYNSEEIQISFREIAEDKVFEYENIIKQYNKL